MYSTKLKVVHIHTDHKFILDSNRFDGISFINTVIVISNTNNHVGKNNENVIFLEYNRKTIDRIVDLCHHSDSLILYDLSAISMQIALTVSTDIKIFWRFFGHELYSRIKGFCYSEKTEIVLKRNLLERMIDFLSPRKLVRLIRGSDNIFERTLERIDYFLCFSTEEYELLKEHFHSLPPLIKLNFSKLSLNRNAVSVGFKNIVILGNNRSAYNNHLDLIDLIIDSEMKSIYEFYVLFNYGMENKYTRYIRKRAICSSKIKLIEQFMTSSEFTFLYQRVSALVINGYRQMALGNIFEGLGNGVKVYLNEKNVILHWLRRLGFIIYTLEDFKYDLKSDNFQLSEAESRINIDTLMKVATVYTSDDFQNEILKVINRS